MAAELRHLIEIFREHGLVPAADVLAGAWSGLRRAGLLPNSLQNEAGDGLDGGDEESRQIEISNGKVSIRGRRVSLAERHEIDALHLPSRTRNALVTAGFTTIADLEWGNSCELLHLIDQLGRKSIREIAAKIEQPTPYLVRPRPAARQRPRPQYLTSPSDVTSGKTPEPIQRPTRVHRSPRFRRSAGEDHQAKGQPS